MARMRYLKPEFWTDSKIVQLSPYARLLFMGSWNFAICDAGHLDDDAMALKLKVLPADPVDADEVLAEVINAGRIVRRSLPDGRTYLHVKRLSDHQKVDSRWNTRCPYCASEDAPDGLNGARPMSAGLNEPPPDSPEDGRDIRNSAQEGIGGDRRGGEEEQSSSRKFADANSGPPDGEPAGKDERGRPDVDALCSLLVELMVANDCRRPYVTKAWRRETRLLLDKDKISPVLAEHVLRWCQADPFWKSNIHSMRTFREKFDTLRQQRKAEHEKRRPPSQRPVSEGFHHGIALASRVAEQERAEEHAHLAIEGTA